MSASGSLSARSRALGLYRSILKAHKNHLPSEMRQLGDTYVKSEFKLHKSAKPEHLSGFFREWEKYLHEILMTAQTQASLSNGAMVDPSAMSQANDAATFGKNLPDNMELQDDQRQQLENLKREAEKLGRRSN